MYRATGEQIASTVGDAYLAQASGWELIGLTTLAVTAGVFGGYVAVPVGKWLGLSGFYAVAFEGAVAGGAEYLAWTLGAKALGGELARGPSFAGFASHSGFGAAGGVAARGVGRYLARPGAERLLKRLTTTRKPGSLLFNELQGRMGKRLARLERYLRLERIVGEEITLRAGGKSARADLIARKLWSRRLRVVEAKLGPRATAMRGQPIVYKRFETPVELLLEVKRRWMFCAQLV